MILLDTNIVSEAMKPRPEPAVTSWFSRQSRTELYLCVPVLAEIYFGLALMPTGRRRDLLSESLEAIEAELFSDRIIAVDRHVASSFGYVAARRKASGLPIAPMDALIAATAIVHSATLATRNVKDFEGLGLTLINPFEPTPG